MKVAITKAFLETCGTSSLEGLLLAGGILEPEPVTLCFHQTSYAWRKEHGGPDIYLMPEFAPYCLIDSVLKLTAKGFKITLEWTA